jgi:hypothetical protein
MNLPSRKVLSGSGLMAVWFEADMTPVQSSSIEAIGRDLERRPMAIRFKGGAAALIGMHTAVEMTASSERACCHFDRDR